jgi:hypothetical protein
MVIVQLAAVTLAAVLVVFVRFFYKQLEFF